MSIVTFEVDIPNTHLNTIVYFINGKSHLLLWKVVSLLRALKISKASDMHHSSAMVTAQSTVL